MSPRRVLIADDDPDLVEMLTLAFETEGVEVSGASSGEEALERLADAAFDLVLLDVRMPGRGGLAVACELLEARPEQRVALMTGFAVELVPELRQAGCPVLRKPLDMRALLGMLG